MNSSCIKIVLSWIWAFKTLEIMNIKYENLYVIKSIIYNYYTDI